MGYRCEVCTSVCHHSRKQHVTYRALPARSISYRYQTVQGSWAVRERQEPERQEVVREEAVCTACQRGLAAGESRSRLRRLYGPESRTSVPTASAEDTAAVIRRQQEALALEERRHAEQVRRLLKPAKGKKEPKPDSFSTEKMPKTS